MQKILNMLCLVTKAKLAAEIEKRKKCCEDVLNLPDRVANLNDVSVGRAQEVHIDVHSMCEKIYYAHHPHHAD